jgi:hypothetical protein
MLGVLTQPTFFFEAARGPSSTTAQSFSMTCYESDACSFKCTQNNLQQCKWLRSHKDCLRKSCFPEKQKKTNDISCIGNENAENAYSTMKIFKLKYSAMKIKKN